ncbi:MAG: DUF2520 domain-containing protein [Pyrinomonadaceae bacterium]
MHSTLSFIGAGRLGGALALALARRGYQIKNIVSRSRESANELARKLDSAPNIFGIENLIDFKFSQIVLITVPDSEIELTAVKLSRFPVPTRTVFLHTSGALSSEVLQSLRAVGGAVGSLHPLVSVSNSILGAEKFVGAYFCLEGDLKAVEVSKRIVADLKGNAFSIPTEQKSLYHAAAVMTSGHLVALFDLAVETLVRCGLEKPQAQRILLPLVQSTIENLTHQTPADALTGTFARADLETMKKHLAALTNQSALKTYVELGLHSLQLAAERGGADAEKIAAMRRELENL